MDKKNPIQNTPNGGFLPIQKKVKVNKNILVKSSGFKTKFMNINDIIKK
jgi:hypothetical protein